ncbi:hypothetical protein EYF80_008030 [Liparis tanakae]|uniref:Uncharacterized protein n=1 Tax=Liparis tanakae TaxID=230148 RepID=A0A4Z2IVL3_9TELE|nr:hypothetical protein EYF80_008030 [Liparis tanakae]
MSAVKRSEVLVPGPEDSQRTDRRSHAVTKQLPPTEGRRVVFLTSRFQYVWHSLQLYSKASTTR